MEREREKEGKRERERVCFYKDKSTKAAFCLLFRSPQNVILAQKWHLSSILLGID